MRRANEASEELVEPGDGQSDPARARLLRVRIDEERGVLVDVPQHLIPDAKVWGRPKNRVYQVDADVEIGNRDTGYELGDRVQSRGGDIARDRSPAGEAEASASGDPVAFSPHDNYGREEVVAVDER